MSVQRVEAQDRLAPPRFAYIDAAKVVAMMAVVAIHVYGVAFFANPAGSPEWWAAGSLYSTMIWAVPVFVMASGALLLGSSLAPGEFYRRRLGKLLPAVALFVPGYILFGIVIQGYPSDLGTLAAGLASGRPYNHLYFLPLILGLYAVAPLFHRAFRGAGSQFVWGTALGFMAMAMLDPVLSMVTGVWWTPSLVTWWVPFVGYFTLGFALKDTRPRVRWALLATCLSLIACLVVPFVLAGTSVSGYAGSYLSVHAVAAALSLFLLFKSLEPHLSRVRQPLAYLSSLTLGVYLGHLIVASALFHVFDTEPPTVLTLTPVVIGTIVVSFALCAVAARIPGMRRFIGL